MFLVLTLGLIGTWQVFDQIYVMSQGNPAKTTLTPAFLSYRTAFKDFDYGRGAAISFVLFLIIVVLTLAQRWVMRDRDEPAPEVPMATLTRRAKRAAAHSGLVTTVVGYAVLIFFALVFIYPFVIQLANSLKTEPDAAAQPALTDAGRRSRTAAFERLLRRRLPALARQLGAGHRRGHGRPGVPRLAGRLRARPAPVPRTEGGLRGHRGGHGRTGRRAASSRSSWCSTSSASTTRTRR